MKLNTFYDNFNVLAEAPNGIKKLRELILQLAVQGKLVSQNPNDKPASVLLEKIKKEKEKLIEEGKIKKPKPLPAIDFDEVPFKVPEGWESAYLGNISMKITDGEHLTPERASHGYYLLSARNVRNEGISLEKVDYVPKEEFLRLRKRCDPNKNDLLISCSGSVGRVSIVDEDNKYVMVRSAALIKPFHSYMLNIFIAYALRSPFLQNQIKEMSRQVAQANLFLGKINQLKIIVPPLAEQKRIVTKVDQLMALCGELEDQQNKKQETCIQLNSSSIDKLLKSETSEELLDNWQCIYDNFNLLYDHPENVSKLREAILQLAVKGKLVRQDPNDEPASVLLQRITSEKYQFVKEGKIKKQKPFPEITDEEKPFEMPHFWEPVRLQQIIQISSGNGLTAANMNSEGVVPVFGGNGITGYHDKGNVFKPTLVIGRVGYYCGSIHLSPESAWVTDNAFVTTFSENNIYIIFLYWLLKGTNLKENENATAQPVISGRKLYPIIVGLPPKAEQHRIVAKVDKLMAMCDELEAKLKESHSDSEKLVAATVTHLLAS
jgi:type I restriction enzyme, S subunit